MLVILLCSIKHTGFRINRCIIVTEHQTCKEKQCYEHTHSKHAHVSSDYDSCVSICCSCVCFPQRNAVVDYIAPRVSVFDAAYFLTDMLSGSYRPGSPFDNRTEAEPAHIFCIDRAMKIMHLKSRAVRKMTRMKIDPRMLARPDFMPWDLLNSKKRSQTMPGMQRINAA